MIVPKPPSFEPLSKHALHQLCDRLLLDDNIAVEECVSFVLADTKGVWHGRARAMMCRRLKHCNLTPTQRHHLVDRILGRLNSSDFSEQFRDQLRLVLYLNKQAAFNAAVKNLDGIPKDHVKRLSLWILKHSNNSLKG